MKDRKKYCQICATRGTREIAKYDAKTIHGPWAFLCEAHFKEIGVGLGIGKGTRLIQ